MPLMKKEHIAKLQFERSLVYEILTDYDNYFEWLPFITHSKLLAREGDLAIAEFEASAPAHAKFAMECIQTKNQSVVVRRISGNIPIHQMVWSLQSSAPNETQVSLRIDREWEWKAVLPWIARHAGGQSYLDALTSRVTAFSTDFLLADETGKKILEAFETDDGLDLWILGKKYVLKAVPGEAHD